MREGQSARSREPQLRPGSRGTGLSKGEFRDGHGLEMLTLASASSLLPRPPHSWTWLSSHMGRKSEILPGELWGHFRLVSLCFCVAPAGSARHWGLPSHLWVSRLPSPCLLLPLTGGLGELPPGPPVLTPWTPTSYPRANRKGIRDPAEGNRNPGGMCPSPVHPGMCW